MIIDHIGLVGPDGRNVEAVCHKAEPASRPAIGQPSSNCRPPLGNVRHRGAGRRSPTASSIATPTLRL
jgi:hypothetical protein